MRTQRREKSTISQITIHKIYIEIVLNYAAYRKEHWLAAKMNAINKKVRNHKIINNTNNNKYL